MTKLTFIEINIHNALQSPIMKNLNFYLVAILFLFSSLCAHAADLATAKVLKVTGDVLKYNAEGGNEALKEGDSFGKGTELQPFPQFG